MIPGVTPQDKPHDAYSDGEWALGILLCIFVIALTGLAAKCAVDLLDYLMEVLL